MPPIAKPKENRITKLAKAVKARSPLPSFVNDAILPTDVPTDVAGLLPMGTEIQAGASMLSPLISIYRNKAERDEGVEAFRQSLKTFTDAIGGSAGYNWDQAGAWLAKKYPRIAAHLRHAEPPMQEGPMPGFPALAALDNTEGKVYNPMAMALFKPGADAITRNPAMAKFLMAHEATHGAQSLGHSNAMELYDIANEITGYDFNPFEVTANYAGSKAAFNTGRGKSGIRMARYMAGLQSAQNLHPVDSARVALTKRVGDNPAVPAEVPNALRMLEHYRKLQPPTSRLSTLNPFRNPKDRAVSDLNRILRERSSK